MDDSRRYPIGQQNFRYCRKKILFTLTRHISWKRLSIIAPNIDFSLVHAALEKVFSSLRSSISIKVNENHSKGSS